MASPAVSYLKATFEKRKAASSGAKIRILVFRITSLSGETLTLGLVNSSLTSPLFSVIKKGMRFIHRAKGGMFFTVRVMRAPHPE